LRSSFYGAEALREQRGRNELKVMVRLPEAQRSSEHDLDRLLVGTSQGSFVPLGHVATFSRGRAPTEITREEGKRTVNVSADLAAGVKSSREVLEVLNSETLVALKDRFPGLGTKLVGQQREQNESFSSLGPNYLFALFVIFALLAVPFKSYIQPFIVMSAIPFGIVGAVLGHVVMGYSLSFISVLGIIALSGVVVNDSLVLIDATNGFRNQGMTPVEAIVAAGMRRLRPILLTSLTTFLGLMPMIFETSLQARFLIPMAISLGFGALFVTVIVLLLVPALYLAVEDLRGTTKREAPESSHPDGIRANA
jgi:multidrug efflux pump subunit AcrB